jgi:hypothetical protein
MSRSIGNCIADSLALSVNYARRLLNGVTPENYARFAAPGGQVVEANHPAFTLGHLALYPVRVIEQLGEDATAVTPSPRFLELFAANAKCVDDAQGSIYPAWDEITKTFFDHYAVAEAVLRRTPDEKFQAPSQHPTMAEKFPTLGSMHAFYCGGHLMMHLGQLSTWRRMQGLGPA